ncbi:MAG: tetratricopeptide repeat protein, partial [Dysgonamonadaceae bacterium]|nr:tetratricopeptide repeat protein [Dysgonamonadaceae bacterium]
MNTKKIAILAALFLSVAGIYAGNNERGIDLYRAELYEAAKVFFLEQTNQSPQEQAENLYYLGQTYSELQQNDLAADCYKRAIETAPEYAFGYIGEGKLALAKNDAKAAGDLFKKALSLAAKKDASVATAIAEACINAEQYPQAEEYLAKAEKANKKYPGLFMARGDMALKQNKPDQAYSWYEQAKYFDSNSKLAYLKLAKAYENTNSAASLDYLNQLIQIDPEYIPAYALIGDINRASGKYGQALAAYEKFISIPGVPVLQHERYAQLLYFTKQYQKSLDRIAYVLQHDPNNPVMHRLQGYNHFELGETALTAQELEQFLANNPVDKHIYLDYITYGRALVKEKQPEKAIEVLLKAAELDPSKSEVYKELTTAYENQKNYPEAIKYYQKYFETEQSPSS